MQKSASTGLSDWHLEHLIMAGEQKVKRKGKSRQTLAVVL
jgi:hypothetical protein